MERTRITFWGVRGSVPAPGRGTVRFGGNTACVEISSGGSIIVCDAGTGIRPLGEALLRRAQGRPISAHLLLTHLHWDHFIGLPFFAPLYDRRNRFVVGGPKAGGESFKTGISRIMRPPYFPVPLAKLPARLAFRTYRERSFHIGDVQVIPSGVNHPGGALGWRFLFPGGASLVHITDNEPASPRDEEKLIAWMRGADALIHDAQYTPAGYLAHRGWGHSPWVYPIELAARAGIQRLWLFHFDPSDGDRQLALSLTKARAFAKLHAPGVCVEMAREGVSFSL